jgi:hypothetical protein
MSEPSRREAALVARAWREPGADPPLRVRLTMSIDIGSSGPEDSVVVTSIPAAAATVEEWLSSYLNEG